jgi:hypothetical protein
MRAGHALALAKGAATYVPFAYSMLGQKRMMTAGVTGEGLLFSGDVAIRGLD